MSHTPHCHLSKSFRWYKNWHTHPHHQHAHWSVFLIITFFVFSSISGSINSTNQFYPEQNSALAQAGLTLGISGNKFTVNGNQQFLLFISYFDAMNASDAILDSDFAQLKSLGFNGVRILPNWFPQPANQLMDVSGNLRPGMLNRLINIIQKAQNNNLVVDVTFCRECVSGLSVTGYQNGIVNTAQGLTVYRNLYFDIQNEADHPNNDRISATEAKQIRDAVKAVDSQRIVSVSLISDSGNEQSFVINGAMDFHPTHGPFSTLSGTRTFVSGEKSVVPGLPVHMQEPDRCRGNPCAYSTNAFLTSATDAKCSGAAGWNFHTRAGYDLTTYTLFNQWLDPNIENGVANGLASALANTSSNSCSSGPPPPPPPSAGGPPYGFPFECPAGYIALTRSNASSIDTTETPGWYADEDGIFPESPLPLSIANNRLLNGAAFPVNGLLVCTGSGTAFLHDGSWWHADNRGPNDPGWTFTGGRPYKNGVPVQFIAEMNCSVGNIPLTIPNGSVNVGGFTTSTSGVRGTLCVRGTDASVIPPPPPPSSTNRYLLFATPDFAPAGTTIILSGQNLGPTVQFFDSSRTITTITGVLDPNKTEVAVILPSNLTAGNYTVRIGDFPDSNEIPFEVTPGMSGPGTTGTESPIITSINPLSTPSGGIIEIVGEFLDTDVQFSDANGQSSYATGVISEDGRVVTVIIPNGLPAGAYTISIINPNDITTALDLLTITDVQNPIGPSAQSIEPPTTTSTFQSLIDNVFNYAIMFVGIAVFVMIMWAGFLWVTSAVNPGNISTAKGYISNAIFGGILLLSSYVILYTINPELVGGTFNLKGIDVPPPVQVPQTPSNRNVISNTGCGTNQQFAQDLIDDLGISNFSNSAGCGGSNNAYQNIVDMASGICPSVCADQCTPACTAGGPTGDITVDPEILEALSTLRTGRSIRFTVTSFTTGDHSLTSYHYAGRAVDIVVIPANSGVWSEARNFLNSIGGSAICEIAGTVIPKCDDFSSGAHIHWQK